MIFKHVMSWKMGVRAIFLYISNTKHISAKGLFLHLPFQKPKTEVKGLLTGYRYQ